MMNVTVDESSQFIEEHDKRNTVVEVKGIEKDE